MEAKELMIGDWVQGFVPDSYSTIYGIFNEGRIAITAEPSKTYIELSPEDVQPIPLTPEILEKNGFGYFSIGGAEKWYIKDDYYDLYIYEWSDSIWVLRYESTEMNIPGTQVIFSYIHQLQHALWLCGIDKEIEL